MNKRTKFILLGVLLILVGIISLPICFIYITLIDSDLAPLLIFCIVLIIWGGQLLVKGLKLKSADTDN